MGEYLTVQSANQTPAGGWDFFQPQTGWRMPSPTAWTLGQAVNMIIKMRLQNKAVTVKHQLRTDYNSVAQELIDYTNARLGNPEPPNPKTMPPSSMRQVAGAAAAIKKLASGAAILLDWEISGQAPVPKELSHARAAVCASCPKNRSGDLTEWFTVPVSERLRAQLGRLHEMSLTTPDDERLNVCESCLCPLKLKVHTPLSFIMNRLKPEAREELHPACWILKEMGLPPK